MNKKELRIVFMGTPHFAVATLDALVKGGYNVVGVVTSVDKPAGRGRKINESAVKQYALNLGIPILQPPNLKNDRFLKVLKSLKADLNIVVAFRMLPKVVWDMPKFGTFNLHASLLPNYRGAAPINWALINGEKETGVTTFFIDDKIDTGAVIAKRKIEIDAEETAGELHDKLMNLGSQLVLETVDLIASGEAKTEPQKEHHNLRSAPKLNKDNCRINWHLPITSIFNHIRGLSPYPAAWTELINGDKKLDIKIFQCRMIHEDHNHDIGHLIVSKKEVFVAVKNGLIELLEIQLPGKRKMEVESLLNGYRFDEDAKVL